MEDLQGRLHLLDLLPELQVHWLAGHTRLSARRCVRMNVLVDS
jgi:hypothetical protein